MMLYIFINLIKMADVDIEGIRIQGFLIKDLLKDDFVKELAQLKADLDPVALVLIGKVPLTLGHQKKEEIDKKIIHINCPNSELLDKFVNLIKKKIIK